MPDLTFGEQVKIILSRKGMTIKELAEIIEERTGKKMSRQNLTQRLGRDNFQEQDMRMIASILGCPFQLSILGDNTSIDESASLEAAQAFSDREESFTQEQDGVESEADMPEEETEAERGITVGEFLEMQKNTAEADREMLLKEVLAEMDAIEREDKEWEQHQEQQETEKKGGWRPHRWFRKREEEKKGKDSSAENKETSKNDDDEVVRTEEFEVNKRPVKGAVKAFIKEAEEEKKEQQLEEQRLKGQEAPDSEGDLLAEDESEEEDLTIGDVNPYTGREYASNSVRMHPKRIGYVQVYNRKDHKWTDMTEWAFLGYQERKKVLLGKDYEPPIYLD